MSLTTSQIKFLSNLGQKRFRNEHSLFTVEGVKMVDEALNQSKIKVDSIYATSNWIGKNGFLMNDPSLKITEIKEKELSRISNLKNPNQVFCVCKQPEQKLGKDLVINDLSLYLDRIKDPGNFGTILRVADWFGIKKVIFSPETVEVFNPKVVQSTMGAIFRVDILEMSFDELFKSHKDLNYYAAVMNGVDIFKTKKEKNAVIVIGNESHGVSDDILNLVENKVSIPAPKSGGSESLNAAVATGIICSVFRNL